MLKRKTLKTSNSPDIENELLRWFTNEYEEGRMVTSDVLQEKALELFGQQLIAEGRDASAIGEDTFKATSSWMRNFKRRHGIKRLSTGDGYDGLTLPDEFKLGGLATSNMAAMSSHQDTSAILHQSTGVSGIGAVGSASTDGTDNITSLKQLSRRVNSLEQVMQQNIMHLEARLDEVVNLLQSRQ